MTEPKPISAGCHCGAVSIRVAAPPDYINECNCSLCNSHGVWWGYYVPTDVEVTGETKGYGRVDRDKPAVNLHFCTTCGCTTHWTLTEQFVQDQGANDRMGVNMRLFDRAALTAVELRYPDGANWDGVGQWGFVREAVTLD